MKPLITFGEVMLRLSTPGYGRFVQTASLNVNYGGGEANVAAAAAFLGLPARHVTRFPANEWGQAAAAAYRRYGVDTRHVKFAENERMGTYFLEFGAMMRATKVIYDRAGSAFATMRPDEFDWESILADAGWFHFTGITPGISEAAAQSCLTAVQTANRLGVTVSADVNSRKNLWQWGKTSADVMPELTAGCDLIVCGGGDAEELYGIHADKRDPDGKFASMCKQIQARFPRVKKILTTKRGSISANHNTLMGRCWANGQLLETPTYDMVPMVDRIGGGDAFLGGFVYGLDRYADDQRALDFATAASALKHSIEGDFNLVSPAEVEAVMAGETSGKLSR